MQENILKMWEGREETGKAPDVLTIRDAVDDME
jgi:hypothetical protein